jgi:hypothetical protein
MWPDRDELAGIGKYVKGLVRSLAGLMGEHRRDWVHALLAETDDQPTPSARLAWPGGGLWLVAREVLMNRIIQALAFVAGSAGVVWIAWPGASTNSAIPVNRMYVVGTLVLLARLPLPVRRYVGPVRPGWGPRRAGRVAAAVPAPAGRARRYVREDADSGAARSGFRAEAAAHLVTSWPSHVRAPQRR